MMSGKKGTGLEEGLQKKLQILRERIAMTGSVLVAYSGGVDSGLLAVIAHDVLGSKARCALLASPLIPPYEVAAAQETAELSGLACVTVAFPVMEEQEFCRNPRERCYLCKRLAARILKLKARELGLESVADGANTSDLSEFRPGLAASDEEGIVHPFIEAGIDKEEIRRIARSMGLDFWNKPSSACLATRLPYNEEITVGKLLRIGSAEAVLKTMGFRDVRVRSHEGMARIEVPPGDLPRLFSLRREIASALRRAGFFYVALDLEGYRTGSMDEGNGA